MTPKKRVCGDLNRDWMTLILNTLLALKSLLDFQTNMGHIHLCSTNPPIKTEEIIFFGNTYVLLFSIRLKYGFFWHKNWMQGYNTAKAHKNHLWQSSYVFTSYIVQRGILEQEVCSTTPIKIKSSPWSRVNLKTLLMGQKTLVTLFLWHTV